MEKAIKFLAVAILIGCLLISAALVVKSFIDTRYDRYYFSRTADGSPMVFDNVTGKYYYYSATNFYEVDTINTTRIIRK